MSEKDGKKHSVICAGSSMNHRTFNEEESWNSLNESTILAGQVAHENCNREVFFKDSNNLSNVCEEGASELDISSSFIKDSNILNVNIDAISSDDEVFYDCSNNSVSPRLRDSLEDCERQKTDLLKFPSHLGSITSDSGINEICTGALLALDFEQLNSQHHSSPTETSEASCGIGSYGSSYCASITPQDKVKKKLGFNERSPYTKSRIPKLCSPSLVNATCKVSELKKFFEKTGSSPLSYKSSKIPVPLSRNISVSAFADITNSNAQTLSSIQKRNKGNQVEQLKEMWLKKASIKKFKSPIAFDKSKSNISAKVRSFRSSSCSDCPSTISISKDSLEGSCSKHSRSLSASDIETISKPRVKRTPYTDRFVTQRRKQFSKHSSVRVIAKKSKSPRKVSAIMMRKSLGFVSSPIKPVSELRKRFIPREKDIKFSSKVPKIFIDQA